MPVAGDLLDEARRELHDRAVEPGQRDARGRSRAGHDHRRRRRADALGRRRFGDRGQQRHRRRNLQRHALRASGRAVSVVYETAEDTRERRTGFRDAGGHHRLRRRRNLEDGHGAGARRRARRGERDLLPQADATRRTRPSAMQRASGRSPTTTPTPTLSVGDVTVTEGNAGTTDATFTVSLSAVSGQDVSVAYATRK